MKTDLTKHTLSNGLIVYLYSDSKLKRTVFSYNVNYGTSGYFDKFYYKDELYTMPPGMAHFLEHMLIEESKFGNMLHKYSKKNYSINGGTGAKLTSYYFLGIKDTKEAIREFIEMIDDPVFTPESVENVKGAIIAELQRKEDSRYSGGNYLNSRNTWKAFEYCPESCNPLGTVETTKSITYEQAKVCYDAYYNTENKFIVIGGSFDEAEMLKYLEEIISPLPKHPNEMKESDYGDLMPIRKEYDEIEKPIDTDRMIITYKARIASDLPLYYIHLYLNIYGWAKFSQRSEFSEKLNNDKIIIGSIQKGFDKTKDIYEISVSAFVHDAKEFETRIDEELKNREVDKYTFDLTIKDLKVENLSNLDFIYFCLMNFPFHREFTEKIFEIDKLNKADYDEFIKLIKSVELCEKTTTLIKAKKMN